MVVEVMVVVGDGGGGRGDGYHTWCNWYEVNNPSNFLFQEINGNVC